MSNSNPSPDVGLDRARAFIEAAEWAFASSMPWFAHEYATRQECRKRGIEADFESFVRFIETAGYWRPWGGHHWQSVDIDSRTYWLYRGVYPVGERVLVNRWWTQAMGPASAQLTLEVD